MKRVLVWVTAYLLITLVIAAVVIARIQTGAGWFAGNWLIAFTVVSLTASIIFLVGCYRCLYRWFSGQWENRFDQIDKRLMGLVKHALVQQRTLQDRLVGYAHLVLFASFILIFVWYTLPSAGIRQSSTYLSFLHLLYLSLVLSSSLLIYARVSLHIERLRATPRDLLFPSLLLTVGLTYFVVILWDAAAVQFAHVFLVLIAFSLIPYTKLTHIIAAPMTVFLGAVERPGTLALPFDLSQESEAEIAGSWQLMGAGNIRDLYWHHLVSLDACTECARCDEVCPAFQTGDRLTPKGTIIELRAAMRGSGSKVTTDYVSQEELLACTTCGACNETCPVLIDPVGLVSSLRRYLVFEGRLESGHQKALQRTLEQYNPWGFPWNAREQWSTTVDIEKAKEGVEYDFLYWVGCAASFDNRAQMIAKRMTTVLKRAGLKVAILGNREMCCGEFARRIGDEGLFQNLALSNIEAIASIKAERVITHCPHCFHTFKEDYPQLGKRFEVFHHTQVLAELLHQGKLSLRKGENMRVAYHDPCYLGRYHQILDEPRRVLQGMAELELIELERCGNRSHCCGAGGGRMWLENNSGERIAAQRAEEITQTGIQVAITACPFCLAMLTEAIQLGEDNKLEVKDIVELVG